VGHPLTSEENYSIRIRRCGTTLTGNTKAVSSGLHGTSATNETMTASLPISSEPVPLRVHRRTERAGKRGADTRSGSHSVARRTRTRSSCRTRRPPTPPPTGPPVASTNLSPPTRRVTFPQERYTLRRPLKGTARRRSRQGQLRHRWIELGHASDEEIEKWIAEYDDITQADYEDGENSYISEGEMDEWAAGDADDDRVAFLQCRQAAMRKGATTEFRKMEGSTSGAVPKRARDYMYVAMSNTNRTMGDDEGDIQLNGDEWGAVYRMPLESDYDISEMEPIVTGGPEADICGGCPTTRIRTLTTRRANRARSTRQRTTKTKGRLKGTMNLAKSMAMGGQTSLDVENTIAEPDNIVVMDDGRVVIGGIRVIVVTRTT